MTLRRQDEETADESGRRPVAEDRPIARDDSIVEEQAVHSPAGGWNLVHGWVRSLGAVIMIALATWICSTLGWTRFRRAVSPMAKPTLPAQYECWHPCRSR